MLISGAYFLMAATFAVVVCAVVVAAAATTVAKCREYEKYDDPYPDVSVFKNIAKAVHFVFLLYFGALCGALLLSYGGIQKVFHFLMRNSEFAMR